MQQNIYQRQWKVVGKAGEGEMVSSKLMAKVFKQLGLSVFAYYEYPSLIKGGHQTGQVLATSEQIEYVAQRKHVDVIVAMNKAALVGHESEISRNTVVIVNQAQPISMTNTDEPVESANKGAKIHSLTLSELAKQHANTPLAANIAVLGASAWCLNLPSELFMSLLAQEFVNKGVDVVSANQQTFRAAYKLAKESQLPQFAPPPQLEDRNILLTGNEAIGLGALAGGVQFYSAYPMTPASGLMHYLADQQHHYPIIVKHAEDEIAAINHAIGASFAGVRAMTGSAGGGFALMVESVSLLGVTELPLVIMVGQRPGPATGLPTWTTQADLQFVLHAGHGEFPRIVLTPGTIQEHFSQAKLAFMLAEKYQVPVFILSDKYLLESQQTMRAPSGTQKIKRYGMAAKKLSPNDTYRRYALTETGVSPRSIPGQPHGLHMANSYEHDQYGFATESAEETILQNTKRLRKVATWQDELPAPQLVGQKNAKVCLVSWGSTITVTAGITATLQDQVSAVHLPCVWPFPTSQLEELTADAQTIVVVEGNATGQLQQLIQQETKLKIDNAVRRYDGRPFYQEEIIDWLVREYDLVQQNGSEV
jgi:2-oxoglutarate/2-oxoacid ferredoxin oxidoreductase subunit alpha